MGLLYTAESRRWGYYIQLDKEVELLYMAGQGDEVIIYSWTAMGLKYWSLT